MGSAEALAAVFCAGGGLSWFLAEVIRVTVEDFPPRGVLLLGLPITLRWCEMV